MPLVTMLGLIGNILSILVLRSPRIDMKVTFKKCYILYHNEYKLRGHLYSRALGPPPQILDLLSLHVLRHTFSIAGALVVVRGCS